VEEAALAIVRIADSHMTDLIRRVSVQRGFDPRRFVIYAFGGAGPPHACSYAAGLGARTIVVPSFASEFSAFGIAASDLLAVAEASEPMDAPFDVARLDEILTDLEDRTRAELGSSGVDPGGVVFQRFALLRYRGQVHELRVPVPQLNGSAEPLLAAFAERYGERYGTGAAGARTGVQVLTFMVHASGALVHPRLEEEPAGDAEPAADARAGTRDVIFAGGTLATPIYRAEHLRHGNRITGPAVLEAPTTTVVLHARQVAFVDALRNLVVSLPEDER
jgi:N-methylhydantoinase A